MDDTLDEVLRILAAEGVEADAVKGGELSVACTAAQEERLRAVVGEDHTCGSADTVLLSGDETASRVAVVGARAGAWTPHCARVQPAKLVRGLAAGPPADAPDLVSGRG